MLWESLLWHNVAWKYCIRSFLKEFPALLFCFWSCVPFIFSRTPYTGHVIYIFHFRTQVSNSQSCPCPEKCNLSVTLIWGGKKRRVWRKDKKRRQLFCSTWSLPPRQKTQLKPCPCVQIASELLIQTPLLGDSSPSSLLPAFLCFPWGDFWSQFFNFLFCFVFLALGMWTLSSLTRDRTCTPVLEAQGLNHWTTRDVPKPILKIIQRTL